MAEWGDVSPSGVRETKVRYIWALQAVAWAQMLFSQGCYNCSFLNELRHFTKNKTTCCDERGLVVALRRVPSEATLWLCRIK